MQHEQDVCQSKYDLEPSDKLWLLHMTLLLLNGSKWFDFVLVPLLESLQSVEFSIKEHVQIEAHEDDKDDIYHHFGLVLFAVVIKFESIDFDVSAYSAHLRLFEKDFYV